MGDTQEPHSIAVGEASEWQEATVFHDGDSFFDALEAALDQAKVSIDMEFYIFESDRTGYRIFRALVRAAQRRVAVRLMVDGIGSVSFSRTFRDAAIRAGVAVKVFHELPWRIVRGDPKEKRFRFRKLLRRMNNRNHRKVCVVDGAVAFVGSMNVVDYHLPSLFKELAWRDTGIRVRGLDVAVLVQSFDDAWQGRLSRLKRRLRRKAQLVSTLVRLNVSGRQRRESHLDLLVRIVGAQRRVWITNAYFVPDGSLLRVLAVVGRENVDVRVLVPGFSDVVFIPWVASALHLGLLRAGVRVFEYQRSVLHAKTMLIDDWGLIGSSNLNHRSLLHDLEADLVVPNENVRRSMEDQFLRDLEGAKEVTLENWRNRPLLERLIGRVLLWMRYLL
jgi:cardiolipin synthase